MNEKIDLICPIYWLHESLFEENLKSWIKELPVNNIYLGINNPEIIEYIDNLFHEKNYRILPIFQLELKTLGACLVDLMNRVETKWFVFVHSDVRITPHAFEIMKHYIKPNVGIIESERYHWDGAISHIHGYTIPAYKGNNNYYNIDRAFSGFQIFQKRSIQSVIDMIEDDFIYRNEDLIFQYECIMNGYEYVKTLALHIHQTFNKKWTFPENEAHLMQIKGLIKYTEPLPRITKEILLNSLRYLKSKQLLTIYEAIKICDKFNKKYWKKLILREWDKI